MEWDDCRAVITPHHKYPTPPQMDMNCIVLLNTDAGKCRIMIVAYLFATICYALDCWPNSISFVLDLAFERVQCFARIDITRHRARDPLVFQSHKDLHDRSTYAAFFPSDSRVQGCRGADDKKKTMKGRYCRGETLMSVLCTVEKGRQCLLFFGPAGRDISAIMVYCFCPDTPPEKVSSKGINGTKGQILLDMQNSPHRYGVGLKDACCAEPCCCIISMIGVPFGCTACWARKAVLDKYHNGLDDYTCCQGYLGQCCCVDTRECCKGSGLGLCLEGFCCPVFSISLARIHIMHTKQIRPDPCDYQLIACSNCLQLVSCILDIVAIFFEPARDFAQLLDFVVDLFTCSIAGCMAAQVHHEIKKDNEAGQIIYIVVEGMPVAGGLAAQDTMGAIAYAQPQPVAVAVPVGQPVGGYRSAGAPPKAEEMTR